jgi:hypothetical protein
MEILEAADGRLIRIEVKFGLPVRTEDLAHIRHLKQAVGTAALPGSSCTPIKQTLPFGDRLRAVPLEALRRLAP